MKIITVLNEKGGVAKTTVATHLAMGLARRGKTVVLIDTDIQGHGTLALGQQLTGGLYDLLARNEDWNKVLKGVSPEMYLAEGETSDGKLFVVPSNVETRAIPQVISSQYVLAERVKELEGYIDVVIIDTAPSASIMHTVVYHASTDILHPTECQFLSLNGLVSTLERRSIPNIEQQGITAQTLGIIPTKYRPNTLEQKENFEELQSRYGALVWEPIHWRTIWTETAPTMSAVWILDPKSPAVDEIKNVNRVMQVVTHG